MEKMLAAVNAYIDSHQEEIIGLWRDLVNLEGKTEEKENINLVGARLKTEMEKAGMAVKEFDIAPDRGKSLTGIIGGERKAKPVIFGGHFDTVFHKGEFGPNPPFRIEDGKAYGPGALDMKGGIVMALYIIKALTHAGYGERPLKMVLSSDEEGGHAGSTGEQFMEDEGRGGICTFNMETGPINNNLCTSRSTSIRIYAKFIGVEAHSGNNFTKGRNAIVEAAHKLLAMQELTTLEMGTTVNPGLINGGTVLNAIPGQCDVAFDFRFRYASEIERVLPLAEEILNRTYLEGTKTEYEIVRSGLKLFTANEEVENFFRFVNQVAKENGYTEFGQTYLGGSSDAGSILHAGTPVICSCGVRGEWNHTLNEYAVVDSMFERAKILSAVVLSLKDRQDFKTL